MGKRSAKPKLYALLPEHQERFDEWRDRWIANALSTKPMDEEELQIMREAIVGLYRSAELEPPPEHRIVFAPSPFVATFAAGFASWIWWMREHGRSTATDAATHAATRAATDAATDDATYAATYAATHDATDAATRDATDAATHAATDAARSSLKNWWALGGCDTRALQQLAKKIAPGSEKEMMACAQGAWRMHDGGNQWSAWSAYISFFRDVALLGLDYSKWDHYEKAAMHAGPRWLHPKFCIISDRPEVLKVDKKNQPHCDDGPFCCWRDGSRLYSIHSVRVPGLVVEHPELITAEMIAEETNEEARQIMLDRCPPAETSIHIIRNMKAAG
jgi:hypothetical protein